MLKSLEFIPLSLQEKMKQSDNQLLLGPIKELRFQAKPSPWNLEGQFSEVPLKSASLRQKLLIVALLVIWRVAGGCVDYCENEDSHRESLHFHTVPSMIPTRFFRLGIQEKPPHGSGIRKGKAGIVWPHLIFLSNKGLFYRENFFITGWDWNLTPSGHSSSLPVSPKEKENNNPQGTGH